jgi:hypothetical protein
LPIHYSSFEDCFFLLRLFYTLRSLFNESSFDPVPFSASFLSIIIRFQYYLSAIHVRSLSFELFLIEKELSLNAIISLCALLLAYQNFD